MSKALDIYPLSVEILENSDYVEQVIYPDLSREYYWSSDFSPSFYIAQAKAGFMSISEMINGQEYLLPEIQRAYAALYFENIHIGKKVKKVISRHSPQIHLSCDLDMVAEEIDKYHKDSWLSARYLNTLKSTQDKNPSFKAISAFVQSNGELVVGEIGYLIGSTYTSLTGFSSRKREYRDWGKVQMVLLAQVLHRAGFTFWNLGHPYMPYKTALGAKIYTREQFLYRWKREKAREMPQILWY